MTNLKIDAQVHGLPQDVASIASSVEGFGFDCLWTHETAHDAFAPLPVAADHTEEIEIGTRIATAFSRSPMVLAQQAWDLQAFSDGRFILGLGTQVKAHNERRFSVDFQWESPGPRLREVVESIRHIWDVFQGRADNLDYQGKFYEFSLMTDAFNPGPIDDPDIPIYIAAVNEYNIRLAGELCDGLCIHSFNTPSYTQDVIVPFVEEGAGRVGRSPDEVTISVSPFIITGRDEVEHEKCREAVRERIAFYASTPSYKEVMAHHGWVDTGRELHRLTREGKWDKLPNLVTDEMLSAFAIEASLDKIADEIRDTYGDVADRVLIGNFDGKPYWSEVLDEFAN